MPLDPTQIAATGVLTPQAIQFQNQKLLTGQQDLALGNQKLQQGQQTISAENLKQASDKLEYSLQTLAQVHDQASHDAWLMNMQKNGIDTTGDPTTYDPQWQQQSLVAGVSMRDKMQMQALAAYRQGQLGLKLDQINKGVGGWNPVTQSWDTGDPSQTNGVPMLGDAASNPPSLPPIAAVTPNQPVNPPRGSLVASEKAIPTPPQEANVITNGSVGGMPLSGAANTKLASAVNTPDASLPATQAAAMPVNAQQPSAAQVANAPTTQYPPNLAQKVGETTQQYRMRLQSQGIGSTSPVIYAANRIMQDAQNAGKPIPYETAFAIAKKGLGEGQAFDVNSGQVAPLAGAASATTTMANAKETGTQQAEVAAASPKAENAGYGKGLGEQMDQYRTVAQAAQGMDATLNAMKADSQNFRMGAMSDMQGTAKGYLQAIAQGLGVQTPEMDSSLGAQQAFTKSAMGLVMGGMQKVQGRAFGEMKAIQSAFPTQAMSQGGFDLVTDQIAGTNQYSEAMYQAAQSYKNQNGTLDGFESQFQKNISPWAYVVKNMDQQSLAALSKTLSTTPQGQKELHMLADQIDYATKNGLMQ